MRRLEQYRFLLGLQLILGVYSQLWKRVKTILLMTILQLGVAVDERRIQMEAHDI